MTWYSAFSFKKRKEYSWLRRMMPQYVCQNTDWPSNVSVYNWKLDDERYSLVCISDAKVNDDLRYSGPSPLIWIAFKHITRSGKYMTFIGIHINYYRPICCKHPASSLHCTFNIVISLSYVLHLITLSMCMSFDIELFVVIQTNHVIRYRTISCNPSKPCHYKYCWGSTVLPYWWFVINLVQSYVLVYLHSNKGCSVPYIVIDHTNVKNSMDL